VNQLVAGAAALAAVLALGACGTTYVETTATTAPAAATPTTLPPVDPGAPVDELLGEIETLMFDLDERIIDEDRHVETFARIDALWRVAERQIRAAGPDDLYNFEQAIELARSGVERRRPADASKGYKIIADVIDAYLAEA
jgi:hypothetical protein